MGWTQFRSSLLWRTREFGSLGEGKREELLQAWRLGNEGNVHMRRWDGRGSDLGGVWRRRVSLMRGFAFV